MAPKITVQVNDTVFNATLADNATAAAFVARLPMSLRMADLNANEKFVDLPNESSHSCIDPFNHPRRRPDALRFAHGRPVLQDVPDDL